MHLLSYFSWIKYSPHCFRAYIKNMVVTPGNKYYFNLATVAFYFNIIFQIINLKKRLVHVNIPNGMAS